MKKILVFLSLLIFGCIFSTGSCSANENKYKDEQYIEVSPATLVSKSSPLYKYGSDWDKPTANSWRIEHAQVLCINPFSGTLTQWGGQSSNDFIYIGIRCVPKSNVAYIVVDDITAYAGMRAFERFIYNDFLARGIDDLTVRLRPMNGSTLSTIMPQEAKKAILNFVKSDYFICWELSVEFTIHPKSLKNDLIKDNNFITEFSAEGEYRLGDRDNRETAKFAALADAKRKIAEQIGVYVESYSEMNKSNLTKDNIRIAANAMIKVKSEKVDFIENGTLCKAFVVADADTDNKHIAKVITEMLTDTSDFVNDRISISYLKNSLK